MGRHFVLLFLKTCSILNSYFDLIKYRPVPLTIFDCWALLTFFHPTLQIHTLYLANILIKCYLRLISNLLLLKYVSFVNISSLCCKYESQSEITRQNLSCIVVWCNYVYNISTHLELYFLYHCWLVQLWKLK